MRPELIWPERHLLNQFIPLLTQEMAWTEFGGSQSSNLGWNIKLSEESQGEKPEGRPIWRETRSGITRTGNAFFPIKGKYHKEDPRSQELTKKNALFLQVRDPHSPTQRSVCAVQWPGHFSGVCKIQTVAGTAKWTKGYVGEHGHPRQIEKDI